MSRGRYKITYLPRALRELRGMREPDQDHIQDAIEGLADDPTPPESIAMKGKSLGLRRLRVGDFRVIYRVQESRVIILVMRVGGRGDVYRGYED